MLSTRQDVSGVSLGHRRGWSRKEAEERFGIAGWWSCNLKVWDGCRVVVTMRTRSQSDVVSRALMVLCNIAAMQEGRVALAEINAKQVMVGLLTGGDETGAARTAAAQEGEEDSKVNWAGVREHAAAALMQLSHHNYGSSPKLCKLVLWMGCNASCMWKGTPRAREKAAALLAILRDVTNADNSTEDPHGR
ncbi:unnamed protein product [Calypogeia fissa]